MGLNTGARRTRRAARRCSKGEDLLTASAERLREIRGNEIAMIFQDPMTSLNPVHKIGEQLVEAMLLHQDVSKKQAARARARAAEGGRDPAGRAPASTTIRTSSRAACASA